MMHPENETAGGVMSLPAAENSQQPNISTPLGHFSMEERLTYCERLAGIKTVASDKETAATAEPLPIDNPLLKAALHHAKHGRAVFRSCRAEKSL